MGLKDTARRRLAGDSTRRLALDVAVRAAELTGGRVPGDWEQLSAQDLLEAARTSLADAAERIHADERRISALQEERPAVRPPEPAGERASPPPIAHELIEVADRLAVLVPGDRTAVTRWLEERVADMLTGCEVARIQEAGQVNPSRHEVVGVRPAPGDEHADHIAETVRPGYEWRDEVVRPQQVVAYVRAGER